MGMVVGSLKTERAARSLRPSVGWPWLCMDHGGYVTRSEFPLCGETTLRAKRRAARSYRQLRSRPSPPLGCGRSPPYLRLVTGVRLASPGSTLAKLPSLKIAHTLQSNGVKSVETTIGCENMPVRRLTGPPFGNWSANHSISPDLLSPPLGRANVTVSQVQSLNFASHSPWTITMPPCMSLTPW